MKSPMGLFLVLGSYTLIHAASLSAQERKPPAVSLAASFAEKDFSAITLTITNDSPTDVEVLDLDKALPTSMLLFRVFDTGGKEVESLGPWGGPPAVPVKKDYRVIKPGETVRVAVNLRGKFAVKPGRLYFLQAELTVFGNQLPAGKVMLKVPYGSPE